MSPRPKRADPSESRASPASLVVFSLTASLIEEAHRLGPDRWGLTLFHDGSYRFNVGWTEILTFDGVVLRLIVHEACARFQALPKWLVLNHGSGVDGFYPSIPGSVEVSLPIKPITRLVSATELLRPAISRAILLSAERAVGKGVRAGHTPEAVRELGRIVGRNLPQPKYPSRALTLRIG